MKPKLPQWVCPQCGLGPVGALDYARCPKCRVAMVPAKEEA
jgi:rubredoxin